MSSNLVSKYELSVRLGISVRTIERLMTSGALPAPQRRGRLVFWFEAAIEAWEAAHCDQQIQAALAAARGDPQIATLGRGVSAGVAQVASHGVGKSAIFTKEELRAAKAARNSPNPIHQHAIAMSNRPLAV